MKKVYLYILLGIFIVSSTETILKLAGHTFDNGIQVNFLRFLIGGLALLIPVNRRLKKRNRQLKAIDYIIFGLLGFLFIVVSMTLYQFGIEVGSASTVAILFSCNPVFNTIFSYFILKEKISKKNAFAIVVSTTGILITICQYIGNANIGIIFALASAVIFGLYSTLSRQVSQKFDVDVLTITCYSFLFGAIEQAVLMAISHIDEISAFLKQNPYLKQFAEIPFVTGISINNLLLLLYLSVIVTAGGFALYFICLREAGSSLSSVIFFAKPAVAPFFATIILNEKISPYTLAGIVVIMVGSYLTYRESRNINRVANP